MKFLSLATVALGFVALVAAQQPDVSKRLVDISDTELVVEETSIDAFMVTVQRTDDLLEDDGTFLAERILSVAFNFDVKDHEVLINKVPLGLATTANSKDIATIEDQTVDQDAPISVTVTVEAAVLVGPALDPETKVDDLMNSFDTGLVTVQVTASSEFATMEDGSVVRRVTLQETVVEVNGKEVVQTDAGQQIIEIMPDGTLGSYTPMPLRGSSGCQGMMVRINNWFRHLNLPTLMAAVALAGVMFLYSVIGLRKFIMKRRAERYAQLDQKDGEEEYVHVAVVEDIKYFDEKKTMEQSV